MDYFSYQAMKTAKGQPAPVPLGDVVDFPDIMVSERMSSEHDAQVLREHFARLKAEDDDKKLLQAFEVK